MEETGLACVYIAIMEGKRDVHFEADVEDMSEMGWKKLLAASKRRLQQGSGQWQLHEHSCQVCQSEGWWWWSELW